ncbi:shikimate dehydrogenase [Nocardia sp. CA-135398]|uniref:shikimate dehydrogenase n=1 Tax=Nocardia sp. CA-135398 TaxID=3239977 RepID=UPI003D977E8A
MTHRRSVLCGLVGDAIEGSFSPPLHETEGRAQGLNLVYRLLDVETLGGAVGSLGGVIDAARQFGFDGVNITHPYKQLVIDLLDELSPDAARLDAVNTVVFTERGAVGHNTDWSGFGRSFEQAMTDADLHHVVLVGAGGAGAAAAYSILTTGAQALTVIDSDPGRAQNLCAGMTRLFPDRPIEPASTAAVTSVLGSASGLINATPIGMVGFPGMPVPPHSLRPDLWVSDIVYRPVETELVRRARAIGAPAFGGAGMNVYQAADAFALFTGVAPDIERMYSHMLSLAAATTHRAA